MKNLFWLLIFTSTFAQASPTFMCEVITNGNGKDWQSIHHFEAPAESPQTSLKKTTVQAYGAAFSYDAAALNLPVPGLDLNQYSVSLHVYLNDDQYELIAQDLTMGEEPKATGNLVDAGETFAVKVAPQKMVGFGIHCAIKPSKK